MNFIQILLVLLLYPNNSSSSRLVFLNTNENQCSNEALSDLGCSVGLLNRPEIIIPPDDFHENKCVDGVARQNECLFGFNKINCEMSEIQDSNDFEDVINALNSLKCCCWSNLNFENVYEIVSQAFTDLDIAAETEKHKGVHLTFKNVHKINSYAFELTNKYVENVYIKLDTLLKLDDFLFDHLVLAKEAFRNMNCKQFTFSNFISDNEILLLDSQMFSNSIIERLVIQQSNFIGFLYAENEPDSIVSDPANVTSLHLIDCFMDYIDMHKIGVFQSLKYVYIINSGLEKIKDNTFSYIGSDLEQLHVVNNLIEKIEMKNLENLVNLKYLNLENNPLDSIDTSALTPVSQSLQKINLASTNLRNFHKFYPKMNQTSEVILSNNRYLSVDDVHFIIQNSPKLKYLDISRTPNILINNLNEVLDVIETSLQDESELLFINATASGVYMIEDQFNASFSQQGFCYLNNLLQKTFVQVDTNHPCNCALLYLYNNILNYYLPDGIKENSNEFLHEFKNLTSDFDWLYLSTVFPKCFYKLAFSSIDTLVEMRTTCGLNNPDEQLCIQTTTQTSTSTTQTTDTTTTQKPTSPTTTMSEEEILKELEKKRKIKAKDVLPILLPTLFGIFVLIGLILLKKTYFEKKRFPNLYERNESIDEGMNSEFSNSIENIFNIEENYENNVLRSFKQFTQPIRNLKFKLFK